jgi:hypothetical protein
VEELKVVYAWIKVKVRQDPVGNFLKKRNNLINMFYLEKNDYSRGP